MRIVFCGSGSFATPSLQAILSSDQEVVGVVTQPPRRAGRGGHMRRTPIAELADSAGLDVIEPPDVNDDDVVARVGLCRPDVICVVEFGQMIRRAMRSQAALDIFNLHGSLLPELRGAAPVNWAIIRGFRRTGVTTFSLVDRMDAGPVYLRRETEILPGETAGNLRIRLAEIGADVVCRTLDNLASGGVNKPQPQDDSGATLAPRLNKADGLVHWSAPAESIRNLIHGVWPWPGAQVVFAPRHGRLTTATIASAGVATGESTLAPGTLDDDLAVCTGRGRLQIMQIKPAGKRLMEWRDFVNGHRLSRGDMFLAEEIIDDA